MPPAGMRVEGATLTGYAAPYAGGYRLEGKLVNGRPAWRHTSNTDCWLAWNGNEWMGQPEAFLGDERGFLKVRVDCATPAEYGDAQWLVCAGGWKAVPALRCIAQSTEDEIASAQRVSEERLAALKAAQERDVHELHLLFATGQPSARRPSDAKAQQHLAPLASARRPVTSQQELSAVEERRLREVREKRDAARMELAHLQESHAKKFSEARLQEVLARAKMVFDSQKKASEVWLVHMACRMCT